MSFFVKYAARCVLSDERVAAVSDNRSDEFSIKVADLKETLGL